MPGFQHRAGCAFQRYPPSVFTLALPLECTTVPNKRHITLHTSLQRLLARVQTEESSSVAWQVIGQLEGGSTRQDRRACNLAMRRWQLAIRASAAHASLALAQLTLARGGLFSLGASSFSASSSRRRLLARNAAVVAITQVVVQGQHLSGGRAGASSRWHW